MRRSTALKILGLAAVSSAVTVRLIQARPAPNPAPAAQSWGNTTETIIDPAQPVAPWTPGVGTIASNGVNRTTIQAEGNTIQVASQAFIYETRPGQSYLWSVRVLDPDDLTHVLFVRRYDEQRFQVETGMPPKEPTFADALELPLPAGTYIVELAISTLNPGADLPDLTDAKVAHQVMGAWDQQKITLGP
jgi:hypothetical protein